MSTIQEDITIPYQYRQRMVNDIRYIHHTTRGSELTMKMV